jgi:GGDEF domain-containing protein
VVQIQDITERERVWQEYRRMATHNQVTGLHNGHYLRGQIEELKKAGEKRCRKTMELGWWRKRDEV